MTSFRLFQTKVFADDNVKSDENSVFKRLALQMHRNQGLFGKGLKKNIIFQYMSTTHIIGIKCRYSQDEISHGKILRNSVCIWIKSEFW